LGIKVDNKNAPKPTDGELEILQILWEKSPASVKYVHEKINQKHPVVYTTTLKLMQIMTEKQLLKRTGEGRKHLYQPVFEKKETQSVLIHKLINSAFNGSASKLVMQVLGRHKPTEEELIEIQNYIKKLEQEEK
jgi:BlaI family penicillinase repressor